MFDDVDDQVLLEYNRVRHCGLVLPPEEEASKGQRHTLYDNRVEKCNPCEEKRFYEERLPIYFVFFQSGNFR